jgi:uncharacterized protein DUF2752
VFPEPASGAGPRRGPTHYALLALAASGVVLLLVLRLFVTPSPSGHGTHEQLGLPPCYPMARWGIPCPGCGVTTSLALAAHGELRKAFFNQPAGFALAVCMVAFALWAVWAQVRGRDLARDAKCVTTKPFLIAAAAVLAAAWIDKLVFGF